MGTPVQDRYGDGGTSIGPHTPHIPIRDGSYTLLKEQINFEVMQNILESAYILLSVSLEGNCLHR